MSDDKTNRGTQDGIRVDASDPNEVEFLHRQFPECSHEQVRAAIEKAGPFRTKIEEYLRNENRGNT
ncbi:hypothetical protein HNQ91_002443 [Filimonas zeae]|uniref:DUF3606 domain-containing protein n=1 Tax=Filimonas zeae TaxID=1737353 RepID=A0A917IU23_9BACT|nr:DUF3606 domain-containing protein [Filimonas zeae]MDR6339392.1 hypothetical protein [Filimonas zeae]GGH63803.1 hypothetical protein GCM10011379_15120 [Filimonas zeae]